MEDIRRIPKKIFTLNADKTRKIHIGTSAQSLKPIIPEMVNADDEGILGVEYDKFGVVALHGIDLLYEKCLFLESLAHKHGLI